METLLSGRAEGAPQEAFWKRTWIAGEIELAPHPYGESIKFHHFMKRIQNQLSDAPKYQKFFAGFSPLDAEYCIKETCPANSTIGTSCPFPNGFTFLSTNRRVFYETNSGIECVNLSDIVKCDLMLQGKISTGIIITKNDNTTVPILFRMPTRYAEHFLNDILNRSRVAKENGDVLALNAAMKEYTQTGNLKLNKKPISGLAILVGISAGIFVFWTSLRLIDSLGGALIIGGGASYFGYWAATTLPIPRIRR